MKIYFNFSYNKFSMAGVNILRPGQNGRLFPDDIFKKIFLNENIWISINISLKFVPRGPINNIPTLVQVMAWHQPGDKPLSEPVMVRLPTHICVTRLQWVNSLWPDIIRDHFVYAPSQWETTLHCIITLQCDILKWPLCDFSALPMSLFGPANVTFRPWGCSLPVAHTRELKNI